MWGNKRYETLSDIHDARVTKRDIGRNEVDAMNHLFTQGYPLFNGGSCDMRHQIYFNHLREPDEGLAGFFFVAGLIGLGLASTSV